MDSRTKLSMLQKGGADVGDTKIMMIGDRNETGFI